MRLGIRCCACALPLLVAAAQAQDVRAGAQLAGLTALGVGGLGGEAGVHLLVQWPLNDGLQLRETLEGGALVNLSGGGTQPLLRLDTTLLSRGETYYGGGLGTGYLPPRSGNDAYGSLFTPVYLLNLHGVVGKDFGGFALEGVARLGVLSSLGLRVNFPLR